MMLSDLFLWFIGYSVIGWVIETILCSINEHKFAKRGFLHGPYCPIYGVGSVLCLLALGSIENPVALFFAAMLLCGTLEYVTGWLLERAFHAKWWDYSDMPLNLHGRICLPALLGFGVLIVLLFKVIHPFMLSYYYTMAMPYRVIWARLIFAVLLADITLTVARLKGLDRHMDGAEERVRHQFAYAVDVKDRLKGQLSEVSTRLPTSPRQMYLARKAQQKDSRWH